MATFDQLSAEKRAIVELVLRQEKSYDELADMLRLPESRVRELARDALVELAPSTAREVEDDWRGQLADYVLGQQSGPETTATRGHLRRSEAARAWTRSLLDSLDDLYQDGARPTIPEAEHEGRERRRERPPRERPRGREREPREEVPRRRELSPEAQAAVRRRRLLAGLGALAALLLLAVLVWPIGLLTGGDDDDEDRPAAQQQQAGLGDGAAGIARIVERDGQRVLDLLATGLPPSNQRQAYEVWLYNSPTDARSVGAQFSDQRGNFRGAGNLPADFARYKFLDVSREPIDRNRAHSKVSVLRGPIGKLKERPANARRGQVLVLGTVLLSPPQGGR